ncbi:neutral/alkaline non-lysosomal ceramidase N-terminal domain-containing protein [Aggregatilinea lenta]|uniref:neutral/alkaline non-lysosomal ceramidase N-terminal domain-containing protein n=1 Tax=Aggregatilinea lenta TaxID=913108 RepID=UPI000E5B1561|nr:neutral/alkaline non-lysosomal ceramidase N-terminal domain-containing protein [Aggregatilinea lenta]
MSRALRLKAGACEVCITPPIGVELAGYGPNIGRTSVDVHDQLAAQALVLDDGRQRIALVTLDIIGVSAAFTDAVRREVEARTDIPATHVMIAASHSHTAPTVALFRDWGAPDEEYVHLLARLVAGAVVAAHGKLQPAALSVGRGAYPDLAWNRTGRAEVDPTVEVLRVDDQVGQPLALLVHYACHPVILGPKPQISADYPGALRQYLKARYSGAAILFVNGACGDIDPVTNRDMWGQGTFEAVERAGRALGEVATQAAEAAVGLDDAIIRVRRDTFELAYQLPEPSWVQDQVAEYARQVEAAGQERQVFGAVTGSVAMPGFWLGYYREIDAQQRSRRLVTHEQVELQAFTLDDKVTLLGIPAEIYTREGQQIRAMSHAPHTLVVGYANGLVGYIPPAEEYARQSYAALLAAAVYDRLPFQPDIAERLVRACEQLVANDGMGKTPA